MASNFDHLLTREFNAFWIMERVRAGLAEFAGPTRVALVISGGSLLEPEVSDEDKLLCELSREEEPAVSDGILSWSQAVLSKYNIVQRRRANTGGSPEIQDWFVQTTMPVAPKEIIEKWLDQAAMFLHIALGADQGQIIPAVAGSVAIEGFGVHILGSCLDELSQHETDYTRYARVTRALQESAKISQTIEEGSRVSGNIAFFEFPSKKTVEIFAEFVEPIELCDHKRVGKLLQAVKDDGCLLANFEHVVGISKKQYPDPRAIVVSFNRGIGTISCSGVPICRIVDGKFRCAQSQNTQELIQKHLTGLVSNECIYTVETILNAAIQKRHGCTVVVDLGHPVIEISGERPKTPFDRETAAGVLTNIAKIDGAVHVDKAGKIHGFGCLLDGLRSDDENRSRGARYNSGLRFSVAQKNVAVFVVSSDGPVSIFRNGKVLYEDIFSQVDRYRSPETGRSFQPLSKWLCRLNTIQ